MSVEPRKNSEQDLGCLGGCLVECDAEQRKRERRIRRRALAISIVLQSAVLVAIVLFPLFAKTERITMPGDIVPIPPYSHHAGAAHPQEQPAPPQHTSNFHPCVVCPIARIPQHPPTEDFTSEAPVDPFGHDNPTGDGTGKPGLIDGQDNRRQPAQPLEEHPHTPQRISTHLDPAMLTTRVEPMYPFLPKQMGRSGKVELRAIIATDGTIQSLQVVSGDPLFYQSALDAVRRWRYRPTYLNGQPVEVDTFITVLYTLQR